MDFQTVQIVLQVILSKTHEYLLLEIKYQASKLSCKLKDKRQLTQNVVCPQLFIAAVC